MYVNLQACEVHPVHVWDQSLCIEQNLMFGDYSVHAMIHGPAIDAVIAIK